MIRQIQQNDIDAITAIYNYYIVNTIVSFEQSVISVTEMDNRINKITSANFPWLVAEQDGKIIGYAYACQWNERSAYQQTAEITVYLSDGFRSKGWGTKLYSALFEALQKTSIRIVIGGIALPNPESLGLHKKFNMTQVAHFKKIGYKFGLWIDVVYLQAELKSAISG